MGSAATMTRRTVGTSDVNKGGKTNNGGGHFEPADELREYLESLSATELRELASYARKMAIGKEDPDRQPGEESNRWLVAQYVHGSGPYFYLQSYITGDLTYTNERGHLVSGKRKVKYIGRRLPADLAEEFGYPEGVTPEDSGVNVTGTPKTSKEPKTPDAPDTPDENESG